MEDVHKVGGTPAVMKYLLSEGLLQGDLPTVTGKTIAQNLAPCPELLPGQKVRATRRAAPHPGKTPPLPRRTATALTPPSLPSRVRR